MYWTFRCSGAAGGGSVSVGETGVLSMGESMISYGFSPDVTAPFGSATPGVYDSSNSTPTPLSIGSCVATPASSYP